MKPTQRIPHWEILTLSQRYAWALRGHAMLMAPQIYFSCIEQAVSLETVQEILQAEVDVLKETLGDDRGSGKTHEFKSSSFPIAKHCYVCGQKVWGMGKVGLSCNDCGIALHSACELKCPPDCGDPQLAAQRASSRQNISALPRHCKRRACIAIYILIAGPSIVPGKQRQHGRKQALVIHGERDARPQNKRIELCTFNKW